MTTMTVWVERPPDDGSAVWGCTACAHGAWCTDHTAATREARTHAKRHGLATITTVDRKRGPHANETRDHKITRLRAQGITVRAIAAQVGISTAGVIKALRRAERHTA